MQTANERLASLGIRNQVDVLRYTQGQLNKIRELLREAEIDLSGKLWRANTEYGKARLKNMLNAVSQYAREVEAQMFGHSKDALLKFGQQQAGAGFQMLQEAIDKLGLPKGLAIDLQTPDFALIAKAAVANPIHGKLLREWWTEWGSGVRAAVSQQVRLGIAENESIDSIVRRILGTKARNYKDGILAVKRRHAEALVRTSVNSVATQAKNDVYEANDDILEAVEWNSTLDGKTTPICQARDGKRAAIGGRPQTDIPAARRLKPPSARPPAHIGCRSTILPVITDWESLGLDNPPPGTRASLDGQVSADLDYEGWLKGQAKRPGGRAFVESILGKAKTDLFLKGKLSLTKFVDLKGNAYTLADLKRNNPKAWKVAFAGKGGMGKPTPKPAGQLGGLMPDTGTGPAWNTGPTWNVPADAKGINTLNKAAAWVLRKSKGTYQEYGVTFTKDGRLYAAHGGDATVNMRGLLQRQKDFKRGTLVHNHPNGEPLSPADIGTATTLDLKTVAAVGNKHKNYYVATDFKKGIALKEGETSARTALRLGDHRQVSMEALDNASYQSTAPMVGKRYANRALIKENYRKGLIEHGEYRRLLAVEREYQANLDIAIAIINNQIAAKYGGYVFKYTLEAGAHRKAVEKILKELKEAGLVEYLEKTAAKQLMATQKLWKP